MANKNLAAKEKLKRDRLTEHASINFTNIVTEMNLHDGSQKMNQFHSYGAATILIR